MNMQTRIVSVLGCALLTTFVTATHAQNYPNRPIRLVTSGVGGGNDIIARVLAQAMAAGLGQPVIVENRGSGVQPGDVVAKAIPDGYTLLAGSGGLWQLPLLQPAPTSIFTDFAPISLLARAPVILVVHPSVAATSVKELIALAKAKPGVLNYSTGATGSTSHLSPEMFKAMAGISMVRIPYKSGATEIADLIGGQVQLAFGTAASVMPHVKSGKLRALAVTSAQPSAMYPGLPTIAETLPGYAMGSIYGLLAPAKTPVAIIKRLNQEVVRFVGLPETRERLLSIGVEAVSSTPEEFTTQIKSDVARIGKVIKDAGIKAD
jgi:tripartite-type tricarboxylate transporter receptor subunit TctC